MDIPPATQEELGDMYRAFQSTGVTPAVFSVLPEYCESFQEPVKTQLAHLRKLYLEEN